MTENTTNPAPTLEKLFKSIRSAVSLIKKDVKALYAKSATIPTKTSQLTNDSGFITSDNDTTYKLVITNNVLKLVETKTGQVISTYDLSVYLDDTTVPKIVSGTYNDTTKKITFKRSDNTNFTVDLSALKNVTKTSQLTNDGSDGTHPFLSDTDVPVIDYVKVYNEA